MRRVLILGAGGRDFHNFNLFFRDNSHYKVVGFTGTQIPGIGKRVYPKELAGELYPDGIPIYLEKDLLKIIKREKVDIVVFSYSDVSFQYVMTKASAVLASGCDFWLLGPKSVSLKAKKPVLAVCAVRTGAGKSPTTRRVCQILKEKGVNFCVVRHPMVYSRFRAVQVFKTMADLDQENVTFEEREEYEPHIRIGNPVLAGVDYQEVLKEAEKYDLIIWDGGNNDFPFFQPDYTIVLCDALRPGDEISYYPGMTSLLMADLVIISKVNEAKERDIISIRENVKRFNPKAKIISAVLKREVRDLIPPGKKVVVVEDGPSVTHGELGYGVGYSFAKEKGFKILDPREFAVGEIKEVYKKYPHLKEVIPALGYKRSQIRDLQKTLLRSGCDFIISATPLDLRRWIKTKELVVQIEYFLQEFGNGLKRELEGFLKERL